jgi:hypothetical protein
MWSPKAEGHSLTKNTSFCGFSAGLHRKNYLVAVSRILVSGRMAAIFAELELCLTSTLGVICGQKPKLRLIQILPPYISPWLQNRTGKRQYISAKHRFWGRSLSENTPFGRFSAGLGHPNQLAVVAEFWFLTDWPPYSPYLNSLDFSTGSVLQPKGQATLAAHVRPSPQNNTS